MALPMGCCGLSTLPNDTVNAAVAASKAAGASGFPDIRTFQFSDQANGCHSTVRVPSTPGAESAPDVEDVLWQLTGSVEPGPKALLHCMRRVCSAGAAAAKDQFLDLTTCTTTATSSGNNNSNSRDWSCGWTTSSSSSLSSSFNDTASSPQANSSRRLLVTQGTSTTSSSMNGTLSSRSGPSSSLQGPPGSTWDMLRFSRRFHSLRLDGYQIRILLQQPPAQLSALGSSVRRLVISKYTHSPPPRRITSHTSGSKGLCELEQLLRVFPCLEHLSIQALHACNPFSEFSLVQTQQREEQQQQQQQATTTSSTQPDSSSSTSSGSSSSGSGPGLLPHLSSLCLDQVGAAGLREVLAASRSPLARVRLLRCPDEDLRWLASYPGLELLQVERLGVAPTHTLTSDTQLAPVSHGCWDSAVVRLRPLQLLRGLSLRNCGLRELMPPRGMQLLQYLDLSGNRLQALQTGFGELPHLRALDLSHNLFDRAPALTNPRLTWLNLSHNWLSDLRGLAGVPQLQYLDVSHNEPLDLSQLNHMTGLVWLDASSPITW